MKRLRDDEKEKANLDVIECDCGYHMGVDGTFLDQVGDFKTECPSCKRGIDTALIFPESEPQKKYDHAYTIAFSIKTDNEAENVTEAELREGVRLKMDELLKNGGLAEMCGMPFDTFEN